MRSAPCSATLSRRAVSIRTGDAADYADARIVGAILCGQHSVLTVCTLLEGEYGLREVVLSVPSMVSGHGVERIIEHPLPEREQKALEASALVIRNAIGDLRDG